MHYTSSTIIIKYIEMSVAKMRIKIKLGIGNENTFKIAPNDFYSCETQFL